MSEKTKKGKKGIVTLIFSRIFMFAIMILLQIIFLCAILLNVNESIQFFYNLITILGFFLVIYIVSERDTDPTMKIIWVVLILAIPIFGASLYLYVKFQFSSMVLKKRIENVNEITGGYLAPDAEVYRSLKVDDGSTYGLANYIFDYAGYPIYQNTEVRYFPSGEDKYKCLLEELEKAEKFIFLEYFIIEEGEMWDNILSILERKQKEGIEVRVMYDGMCSLIQLPVGYYKRLKEKGIQCKAFSPMRPFVSTHQNNRDHRKILVIDGVVAFTGGVNLADEYINSKMRFGYWKDVAIMLKGDAAKSFTLMFLKLWNLDNKTVEFFDKYIDVPKIALDNSQGYVLGYSDEPFDHENVGESVYLHLINTAMRYVHIVTPYLVIDNVMMNALKYAAKRGVEVIIVMPGIPDKSYAYCVARTYYEELIEAGVKIYEFTPGFTHAKMFVVDDERATVGTINLDYRSLYLHFECGALITKNSEIVLMEQDYQDMLKDSRCISMSECRNRPLYYKFAGKVLRLIAPLL